ncbi:MAG: hypothetical protein AAGA92_01190 [Planctomycetota bacterium]
MGRQEVIKLLRQEGFAVTVDRLRHALMHGYLDPKPRRGHRRAFEYTERHLRQLRWYLVHSRPGPRTQRGPSLQLCGSNDRIIRLQAQRRADAERRESEAERTRVFDASIEFLERLQARLGNQSEE